MSPTLYYHTMIALILFTCQCFLMLWLIDVSNSVKDCINLICNLEITAYLCKSLKSDIFKITKINIWNFSEMNLRVSLPLCSFYGPQFLFLFFPRFSSAIVLNGDLI